jgi:hypothetical protein
MKKSAKSFLLTVATLLALLSLGLQASTASAEAELLSTSGGSLPRPPQFVLLAFDGSLNLDMWEETYDFAQQNNLKFTYFISGVYFLLNSKKNEYVEPTHGRGKSAIGWGGTSPLKIQERVDWVNKAYDNGNEIGSHVNGHFDGSKWTLAQWQSEFSQFYHLIFDVFQINEISSSRGNPYHFEPEQIKGFRAPLLGQNPEMYKVLEEKNYAYDTSKTAPMNYWPEKQNGIWNFPLAQVRIAGTGKRTLSMDYNFYYAQSNGKPEPANYAEFKKEMLETYLGYFGTNYHGNRAPIHIGHHFSKWNAGAYWDAMKEFAQDVCGLPEVKCVTYKELTNYMDSLPAGTVAQYRAGHFDKTGMPVHLPSLQQANNNIQADVTLAAVNENNQVQAQVTGDEAASLVQSKDVTYQWSVDGKVIANTLKPSLNIDNYVDGMDVDSKLKVKVLAKGKEVLSATHKVVDFKDTANRSIPVLASQTEESYSLHADPPEAHAEEE